MVSKQACCVGSTTIVILASTALLIGVLFQQRVIHIPSSSKGDLGGSYSSSTTSSLIPNGPGLSGIGINIPSSSGLSSSTSIGGISSSQASVPSSSTSSISSSQASSAVPSSSTSSTFTTASFVRLDAPPVTLVNAQYNLWPLPQSGTFGTQTLFVSFSPLQITANPSYPLILDALQRYYPLFFPLGSSNVTTAPSSTIRSVVINIIDPNALLQVGVDESYYLSINSSGVIIQANTSYGALWALETLRQLIHFDQNTQTYFTSQTPLFIYDHPRFIHRGYLIDTARVWVPVSLLESYIDAMSFNKMNVLHWHITDDQGFAYNSTVLPLFVQGALQAGASYSVDVVRSIIEYAAARGIRVMMEFDTPSHTNSWCAGYPGVCAPNCNCMESYFGRTFGGIDPSSDYTVSIIGQLFAEVAGIAPNSWFHTGGDELTTSCWASCPSIGAWMQQNSYNFSQAEAAYHRKIDQILHSLGRTKVVWEEIYSNIGTALDPTAIVQLWEEAGLAPKVEADGYQMIFSPGNSWYFPAYSWQTMYGFEPLNSVTNANLVLGGEVAQWGDINSQPSLSIPWPRAAAASERLWSPQSQTSLDLAQARLTWWSCNLLSAGINPINPIGASCQIPALAGVVPPSTTPTTINYLSAYMQLVLNSKPILFYPLSLDYVNSTAVSDISGSNQISVWNTSTNSHPSSTNITRSNNGSTTFTGSSCLQTINPQAGLLAFTIELWFITTQPASILVGYSNTLGGYDRVVGLTAGQLYFYNWNTNGYQITSSGSYNDGGAHYVAATFSASGSITMFIDGVNSTSMSNAALPYFPYYSANTAWYWFMGGINMTTPAASFSGLMSNVAIYDYALDPAVIASHFSTGRLPATSSSSTGASSSSSSSSSIPTTFNTIYAWAPPDNSAVYVDTYGTTWHPDFPYVVNGGSTKLAQPTDTVSSNGATANDQTLFRNQRYGHLLQYSVPVVPGYWYTVAFYWAETSDAAPGQRQFSVTVNDQSCLVDFDVYATAAVLPVSSNGLDQAVYRACPAQFMTSSDFKFNLTGNPSLADPNALMYTFTVYMVNTSDIRLLASTTAYVDSLGNTWQPDFKVAGVNYIDASTHAINGASDPVLYQVERFGSPVTYGVPVVPGSWTVQFNWVEFSSANTRIFSVVINGVVCQSAYNIYAAAGGTFIPVSLVCQAVVAEGSLLSIVLTESSSATEQWAHSASVWIYQPPTSSSSTGVG